MKTVTELITPDLAEKYLKKVNPKKQRKLVISRAEAYAREMQAGHWYPTHQGIAFDTQGNLIDGQTRLKAIELSGVSLQMRVTREVAPKIVNGAVHHAIDYIDNGYNRTVGEQLSIRHNSASGRQSQGICRAILMWCTGLKKITVPVALEIISVYPAIKNLSLKREKVLNCAVSGALAVCLKSNPEIEDTFIKSLISGADLRQNSPILKLRELLIAAKGTGGSCYTVKAFGWTLNSVHSFLAGSSVSKIKNGSLGVDYFNQQQKHFIKKIRAAAGVSELTKEANHE